MFEGLLLLVLTQHPLASDDAAVRQQAVAAWAKKKKPQLTAREARALAGCVEVAAVPETGCAPPAKLCPMTEGDDGSSGTRLEARSLVLEGQAAPLRVWRWMAYEPRLAECDPQEPLEGHESQEEHVKEIADWRRVHAREYAKCLARAALDATSDAEELSCDVVLVNACRHEAFVTCSGRNLRKGVKVGARLQRFEL